MRTFSNFAVSFTIISILSGCLTLFGFAMNIGGPAVMTLGWLFVGFFVTLVALGMAEVASSYPTAGGLYYWAAKLAPASGRNPAQVELVRRLVQPHRPGRGDGRHRLRAGAVHDRLPEPGLRRTRSRRRSRSRSTASMLVLHALLNTFGIQHRRAAQRRVGLVAHRRRHGHRHRHASSSTSTRGPTSARSSRRRSTTPASTRASVPGLPDPGHPAVRRADRAAERAVHADRLRRLGPHVRGDARRRRRPRRGGSSGRWSSR